MKTYNYIYTNEPLSKLVDFSLFKDKEKSTSLDNGSLVYI